MRVRPSVALVSDLHLGHRAILRHCPERGGTTVAEHDEWVIERLLSVNPTKRTHWWILGDVAMDRGQLELLERVPGSKSLIAGNHDKFPTHVYLNHFKRVCAMVKRYGMWLTHAPLHPAELRGLPNIHGHCHVEQINDPRYLNVAIEHLPDMRPITLDEVRERFA